MLGKQKKISPYINLTIFSLAAAGLVGIVTKAKKMIMEKAECMKDMLKK